MSSNHASAAAAASDPSKRAEYFVPDARFISERNAIYQALIDDCPLIRGKELSCAERERKGLHAGTLVYGEISFEPFAKSLMKIRDIFGGLSAPGGKFYDIGSGTGKPVFAAALLHPWSECIGIEILDDLHKESLKLVERWLSPPIQAMLPPAYKEEDIVSMVHGDATKLDWSDADVLFMNSTCFDDALLNKLVEASAEHMKKGAFAITFTKELPSAKWRVLDKSYEAMSWGGATIFIQQKIL